jgi:hypothetical protein
MKGLLFARPCFLLFCFTVLLLSTIVRAHGQGPSAPSSAAGTHSSAQAAPNTPESSSKGGKGAKDSHANDFLIRGTVFTDKAYAFPGVQLRVRRTSEKKFRWQRASNSRGEFGIAVPRGAEYELVVHAKGFVDQTRTINASTGLNEQNFVFSMQPAGGKK